jgi:hypothetical protein
MEDIILLAAIVGGAIVGLLISILFLEYICPTLDILKAIILIYVCGIVGSCIPLFFLPKQVKADECIDLLTTEFTTIVDNGTKKLVINGESYIISSVEFINEDVLSLEIKNNLIYNTNKLVIGNNTKAAMLNSMLNANAVADYIDIENDNTGPENPKIDSELK